MRTAAEEVLVWKLQYIIDQDYEVPSGQDPYRIVLEIMEHLGSPDAEEDERFSVPLAAMVETGKVSLDTLCAWLEGERVADSTSFVNDIRRLNWKHVIRSLYFRLRKQHLLGASEERLWQVQEAFTLF